MITEKKYREGRPFKTVFMFVNSSSGGGLGQQILSSKIHQQTFSVKRSHNLADSKNLVDVEVFVFNLRDQKVRENGFQMLSTCIKQQKPVVGVICGGDGTVMWVVGQLSKHHINPVMVPMAIIPLGTGNDFSQTLNWGKEKSNLLEDELNRFRKFLTYLISAESQQLDLWEVKAEVFPHGKFQRVKDSENVVEESKVFQKHFCNYFSFGIDGKVGYSFDSHRTSSRIGNLAMYAMLGAVKGLTKTKHLNELVQSFKEQTQIPKKIKKPETLNLITNGKLSLIELEESNQGKFDKVILEEGNQLYQECGDNLNILALNINSFMGGVKDVWENASVSKHIKNQSFGPQSHSDGKLQFVSFSSSISIGLEKTVGGFADKLYQGAGPFQFRFKAYQEEEKHRTYLQIDGQFIRFTHPRRVVIQKSNLLPHSQMTVLRKPVKEQTSKCCC